MTSNEIPKYNHLPRSTSDGGQEVKKQRIQGPNA